MMRSRRLNAILAVSFLLMSILGSLESVEAKPVEINEDNWESLLGQGEWMVEFFAPWCPACNRFEPTWNDFSLKSSELGIRVGSADVNANPVLSGLFSVTSLPTIYHIKNGQYRIFNGNRELDNLVSFIKDKEWEKIEPSSSWLTPNSFLIKTLSLLFKLTIYFKNVYTELTEKQGFPVWAVLALFVVVTIALGLVMGILLIIFIDCICPPKKYAKEYHQDMKQNDIGDESDLKQQEAKAAESSKSSDEETTTTKRRGKKSDAEPESEKAAAATGKTRSAKPKKDN